jgi:hypothetical protein
MVHKAVATKKYRRGPVASIKIVGLPRANDVP